MSDEILSEQIINLLPKQIINLLPNEITNLIHTYIKPTTVEDIRQLQKITIIPPYQIDKIVEMIILTIKELIIKNNIYEFNIYCNNNDEFNFICSIIMYELKNRGFNTYIETIFNHSKNNCEELLSNLKKLIKPQIDIDSFFSGPLNVRYYAGKPWLCQSRILISWGIECEYAITKI